MGMKFMGDVFYVNVVLEQCEAIFPQHQHAINTHRFSVTFTPNECPTLHPCYLKIWQKIIVNVVINAWRTSLVLILLQLYLCHHVNLNLASNYTARIQRMHLLMQFGVTFFVGDHSKELELHGIPRDDILQPSSILLYGNVCPLPHA